MQGDKIAELEKALTKKDYEIDAPFLLNWNDFYFSVAGRSNWIAIIDL